MLPATDGGGKGILIGTFAIIQRLDSIAFGIGHAFAVSLQVEDRSRHAGEVDGDAVNGDRVGGSDG